MANLKLTPEQVEELRRLYRTGDYSQKELAGRFGVCQSAVSKIVLGRAWGDAPEREVFKSFFDKFSVPYGERKQHNPQGTELVLGADSIVFDARGKFMGIRSEFKVADFLQRGERWGETGNTVL